MTMNAPAAIKGDYCDLKFIKTRKVCQITIEIPIEAGASFVAAFGTPNPAQGLPVALARIDPNAKAAPEPEKTKRKWDELSIAQQAGIMCNEKGFQLFIAQHAHDFDGKPHEPVTVDDAATYVRRLCGVNSRAFIENSADATRKFRDLKIEYDNWLRVPA